MKKRLFLLILTLVAGIYPATYGADHEVLEAEAGYEEAEVFEPNIELPLRGEGIDHITDDLRTFTFDRAMCLNLYLISSFTLLLVGSRVLDRYVSPLIVKQVRSTVVRYMPFIKVNLVNRVMKPCATPLVIALLVFGNITLFAKFEVKARESRVRHQNILEPAITAHNRALVDNNGYEGQILTNQEDDRTLIIRRGNEVFAYPFNLWRRQRREAINGMSWLEKLLLGSENLRRIRAIHERLNTLDNQLRVPRNVKSASR